jgi:TatD DNase family protein
MQKFLYKGSQELRFFDTHCHLDLVASKLQPEPLEAALLRATAANVLGFVMPNVSLTQWPAVHALTQRFNNVFCGLGIHPTDVDELLNDPTWSQQLEATVRNTPRLVAVGETGLDYHWRAEDTAHQAWQRRCFIEQLHVAQRTNKPVIVHNREASNDVLACIEKVPGVTGIMHCFSGDWAFAEAALALGFYISFAGNVTFKNAGALRDIAKKVPMERLLIETDAPYLSPVPERGKINEPSRVVHVAACLAELKACSLEALADATWRNALSVFQLQGAWEPSPDKGL